MIRHARRGLLKYILSTCRSERFRQESKLKKRRSTGSRTAYSGKLKAEIETALWELVAAGLVTADGFDNLRSLIDPKRRAGQGSGRSTRPRHNAGRWALLHADVAVERPRAVEAACWMLLRRYGIVIRDVLAREANLPSWRELLMGFRRLEDRGEIRGGRFVDGFLGEQFALPVAVESVRGMSRPSHSLETRPRYPPPIR